MERQNKFRLNYTNSNEVKIESEIKIDGIMIKQMLNKHYVPKENQIIEMIACILDKNHIIG